ncbi:unnamed protein product, partial [Pylaiella littoralis]
CWLTACFCIGNRIREGETWDVCSLQFSLRWSMNKLSSLVACKLFKDYSITCIPRERREMQELWVCSMIRSSMICSLSGEGNSSSCSVDHFVVHWRMILSF